MSAISYSNKSQAPVGKRDPVLEDALPTGWIKEWSEQYGTWYYIDTTTNPPSITWDHPLLRSPAPAPPYDRGMNMNNHSYSPSPQPSPSPSRSGGRNAAATIGQSALIGAGLGRVGLMRGGLVRGAIQGGLIGGAMHAFGMGPPLSKDGPIRGRLGNQQYDAPAYPSQGVRY